MRTWKGLVTGLILLLVVGLATTGILSAQGTPLVIDLMAQNDSGESGTATLTDLGNGMVRVEVEIQNAPAGVSQPLHIHEGTCADLNPAPEFPLTNLENGTSTTEVETTLDDLLASPYAINGHKSAEEASVYVFCGDIVAAMAQETGTVEATGTVTTEAETATTTTEAETATTTTEAATSTVEATAAATTAAETPTAEAAAETATPAAVETPTTTLPGTGAPSPLGTYALLLALGAILLGVGLVFRRAAR